MLNSQESPYNGSKKHQAYKELQMSIKESSPNTSEILKKHKNKPEKHDNQAKNCNKRYIR